MKKSNKDRCDCHLHFPDTPEAALVFLHQLNLEITFTSWYLLLTCIVQIYLKRVYWFVALEYLAPAQTLQPCPNVIQTFIQKARGTNENILNHIHNEPNNVIPESCHIYYVCGTSLDTSVLSLPQLRKRIPNLELLTLMPKQTICQNYYRIKPSLISISAQG